MVRGDGVGGECTVSVEPLWNRLSRFISPSHLYLRRNVASGLKPIFITCLHFINFRTITKVLPFDSCSFTLSYTFKSPLRDQGCETLLILYSVFPLIAKQCASALSSLVPKVCGVCQPQNSNVMAIKWTSVVSDKSWHEYSVKTIYRSVVQRNSAVTSVLQLFISPEQVS